MIDWVTVKIQHIHPVIQAGAVVSVDRDGLVEWQTPKAMQVAGSYESSIRVRSTGALVSSVVGHTLDGVPASSLNTELTISGNPAKFLQGHNLFGCDDLTKMLNGVLAKLDSSLGIGKVSPFAIAAAKVSRLDFTKSLEFGNSLQAQTYIREVGLRARTRNGRPVMQGHTVGFQKSSKRWNLVVYAKGSEVQAHPLPDELPARDLLIAEAQGLVRVELRLRGTELDKINRRAVSQLEPQVLHELYDDYLGRVEMTTTTKLANDVVLALRPAYRATYLLWLSGMDVMSTMTVPTFYRHRSLLLKYGIDISTPLDESGPNVVPLHKVITGQPYSAPSWANGTDLLFGT